MTGPQLEAWTAMIGGALMGVGAVVLALTVLGTAWLIHRLQRRGK